LQKCVLYKPNGKKDSRPITKAGATKQFAWQQDESLSLCPCRRNMPRTERMAEDLTTVRVRVKRNLLRLTLKTGVGKDAYGDRTH
jgi:hypothetical protein